MTRKRRDSSRSRSDRLRRRSNTKSNDSERTTATTRATPRKGEGGQLGGVWEHLTALGCTRHTSLTPQHHEDPALGCTRHTSLTPQHHEDHPCLLTEDDHLPTVNIETLNLQPIVKSRAERMRERQEEAQYPPPHTPQSLKKMRLWSLLNMDCKINGQTYKRIEKQLLFVRHAEGYHNSLFDERKVHEAINIRDPELTPLGNNQVADLRREVDVLIKSGVKIEKVIVSPMTRTLQTAWGTFGGYNIPFQACHLVSEYCDAPCNYGTKKSQLEGAWPQVDFTVVPEIWWNEDETDVTITVRAKRFREWLFKQPEKCLAIVSHAGFLHELLQEQFRNCELKRINWIHRSRRQARGH